MKPFDPWAAHVDHKLVGKIARREHSRLTRVQKPGRSLTGYLGPGPSANPVREDAPEVQLCASEEGYAAGVLSVQEALGYSEDSARLYLESEAKRIGKIRHQPWMKFV